MRYKCFCFIKGRVRADKIAITTGDQDAVHWLEQCLANQLVVKTDTGSDILLDNGSLFIGSNSICLGYTQKTHPKRSD
jgi:hypothetical protein